MISAAMPKTLHFQQVAMATLFEGWLVGEDTSHLRAVSQVLQAEIYRLEKLLSRHDPQAELARLNRTGSENPVKMEKELYAVLEDCLAWFQKTGGYFDIGVCSQARNYQGLGAHLKLRAKSSQAYFSLPDLWLDLGGYGKGYALDKLGELLRTYEVEHFLLHGGKSSFLARGNKENGEPWKIKTPIEVGNAQGFRPSSLLGGFSYSGLDAQNMDIWEGTSSRLLTQPLACMVQAATALEAEVWSTALLAMGSKAGSSFIKDPSLDLAVTFLEPQEYES